MNMAVAIKHPKDPNRPTVIRDDLYDPAVHELWGAPEAEPEVIEFEDDEDDGD